MSKDRSINYDNYFTTPEAIAWQEAAAALSFQLEEDQFINSAQQELEKAALLQGWVTDTHIEPLHKTVLVETFLGNVEPQYDRESGYVRPSKIPTAKQALALFDDLDGRLIAGQPYLFDTSIYALKPKGSLVGVLNGKELNVQAPKIIDGRIETTPLQLVFEGVLATVKWSNYAGIKQLSINDNTCITKDLRVRPLGEPRGGLYYDLDRICQNFIDTDYGLCVGDAEILDYVSNVSNDGKDLPTKIAANIVDNSGVARIARLQLSETTRSELMDNVTDDILLALGNFKKRSDRKTSVLDLSPTHVRALFDSIDADSEAVERVVHEKIDAIQDATDTSVTQLVNIRSVRRGLPSLLNDIFLARL